MNLLLVAGWFGTLPWKCCLEISSRAENRCAIGILMENQANIMGYYLIKLHEMAYHFGATYTIYLHSWNVFPPLGNKTKLATKPNHSLHALEYQLRRQSKESNCLGNYCWLTSSGWTVRNELPQLLVKAALLTFVLNCFHPVINGEVYLMELSFWHLSFVQQSL